VESAGRTFRVYDGDQLLTETAHTTTNASSASKSANPSLRVSGGSVTNLPLRPFDRQGLPAGALRRARRVDSEAAAWHGVPVASDLNLDRVFPYLKAIQSSTGTPPAVPLGEDDELLLRPFVGSLVTMYVLDTGSAVAFLSRKRVAAIGHDRDHIHRHAMRNLAARVNNGEVQLTAHRSITGLLLDGNLEASLMLLDELCDQLADQLGTVELLAAAPARDIFAVCPAEAGAGREDLADLVERVSRHGDHLLTRDLYLWRSHQWHVVQPDGQLA